MLLLSGCAAPPPPRPSAPKVAHPAIRVGSILSGRKNLIKQVRPVYPKEARKQRIQGVVRFKVLITTAGEVTNIEVVQGHVLLIPAALAAVKQWRYAPVLLNGEPVEVKGQIDMNFTLNQ